MKKCLAVFLSVLLCAALLCAGALADAPTIVLSAESLNLRIGDTRVLKATATPTASVVFASESPQICTVDSSGKVVARQAGYCVITATANGVTAKCFVAVGSQVKALRISDDRITLKPGDRHLLTIGVEPSDAARPDISWISNNPSVATVDYSGKVTARSAGKATITARVQDDSGLAISCAVTVMSPAVSDPTADSSQKGSAAVSAPSPTPTAKVQAAESAAGLKAYVNTPNGRLNLRAGKSGDSRVLRRIPHASEVTVTAYGDAWCRVRYNGVTGYVRTQFLRFDKAPAAVTPTPAPTRAAAAVTPTAVPNAKLKGNSARVTGKGSLNLRVSPSQSARRVSLIPQGAVVEVIVYGKEWCYVSYNNENGYVMTEFLSVGKSVNTKTDADTGSGKIKTAKVVTDQGGLNLRKSPSTGAERLLVIPQGAHVQVLNKGSRWTYVSYNGQSGYVQTEFLDMGK